MTNHNILSNDYLSEISLEFGHQPCNVGMSARAIKNNSALYLNVQIEKTVMENGHFKQSSFENHLNLAPGEKREIGCVGFTTTGAWTIFTDYKISHVWKPNP